MDDEANEYIAVDARGVRRIGQTRISLDSVIIAFQGGQSAEEIQRNFPLLSLEQVYGVIAHYLGHRQDVEEYLRKQRVVWETSRTQIEQNPNAALERLRKARANHSGQPR